MRFDYIVGGFDMIVVTIGKETNIQLSETILSELQLNWTTKFVPIKGEKSRIQVRCFLIISSLYTPLIPGKQLKNVLY